jgi:hypothetical protein
MAHPLRSNGVCTQPQNPRNATGSKQPCCNATDSKQPRCNATGSKQLACVTQILGVCVQTTFCFIKKEQNAHRYDKIATLFPTQLLRLWWVYKQMDMSIRRTGLTPNVRETQVQPRSSLRRGSERRATLTVSWNKQLEVVYQIPARAPGFDLKKDIEARFKRATYPYFAPAQPPPLPRPFGLNATTAGFFLHRGVVCGGQTGGGVQLQGNANCPRTTTVINTRLFTPHTYDV